MHFATDPAQHHVESGPYDTLETRDRVLSDWTPWYDPEKSWWLEKSPVNLTRMRLYQQLFPMSQFVVILRHPEVVAAAVSKWVDAPAGELVAHWQAAHRQLLADLPFLHAVCVLRYEDFCERPKATIAGLHAFLDLRSEPGEDVEQVRNGNLDYPNPAGLTEDLADWGYGPEGRVDPWTAVVQHPLRAIRETTETALAGR